MSRWPRYQLTAGKAGTKAKPIISEDLIQSQVITWAKSQVKVYPELIRLFHVPNGGRRLAVDAAKLQGQGVKPGVPDLCLPVPRFGCHGLWIEMKTQDGRVSAPQKDWIAFLRSVGYRVEVCRSFDEARAVLLGYLDPKVTCSPGIY
ncbi:VRR-NUC domain-containing protein [Achromobacter xylosoxidans]|uniref:VRR-NUC domain-containing protein n=1 Tax=Alcaligenes xylosoxydans xylosoxydans TaxID=85698 RepID=UPI00203C02A7|nr:VRR-NUC domain-containing protein [Achromobacter xylosoxidans]MCM2569722.1 VRR-NUC domain-containing protein [Achromobacter xylosoxidans]